MSTDVERAMGDGDSFSTPDSRGVLGRVTWESHVYPVAKALGLVLVTVWCVAPMYYAFVNSLKTPILSDGTVDDVLTHPGGEQDYPDFRPTVYTMAGAFLTMIVPVALYMYLQKYLLEGLTAGTGIKG